MMTKATIHSVCPYDCPDTCGLLVSTDGDRVTGVCGDPDHPFTKGKLCSKMDHYERTVHSPQRLKTPLLRTGPKGTGSFRPISWEEAISRITAKWREIVTSYGAEAILPCSYAGTMGIVQRNAGHPFFYQLGASRLERTICSPAKDYGWKSVMGATRSLHPDEVKDSDLVILWGSNAAATNIHFLHNVREAKRRGATVYLIETYETPTAAAADEVFLVRPGSDAGLALAMMHILVRDNRLDKAFIDKHVQGFEELAHDILPFWTPEAAASLTGLSVAAIEKLAHSYSQAKAPFISIGSGLSRYGNGAMAVRTIVCLPALIGAWDRPGAGLLSAVGTASALATSEVTREDFMTSPTRIVNINQLGEALTSKGKQPIKSLYVYQSNPAAVFPDQNKVLGGLERDDLFTVVHERFLTDTASYADIVLPATSSLEHSDIYRAYGHYCLRRVRAAIPPVGESRSNWDVFRLLAAAMGFTGPFFARDADEMIDHLIACSTGWLDAGARGRLLGGELVELPLPDGYRTDFRTPSGKIEILNPQEAEKLPRYLPPHGGDGPLWLMTAPSLYGLNSSFLEREDLLRKRQMMSLLMNPADAAQRNLADKQPVLVFNEQGEVGFHLEITAKVPAGTVVAEGVWGLKQALNRRTVNALTSSKLTDRAAGSTFYDTKVDVRSMA